MNDNGGKSNGTNETGRGKVGDDGMIEGTHREDGVDEVGTGQDEVEDGRRTGSIRNLDGSRATSLSPRNKECGDDGEA